MSSGVIKQPNLVKTLVPVVLPALVGGIGKLWSNITGSPADTRILLFAAVAFILGGVWSWRLSKEQYPVSWVKPLYKFTAGFHFLIAASFIAVVFYK